MNTELKNKWTIIVIVASLLVSGIIILVVSGVIPWQKAGSNAEELASFTAQKHRANFNNLKDKEKLAVTNEYQQTVKLVDILSKDDMQNDANLKVATQLATLKIWANKYMSELTISDAELQKLFETQKPTIEAKYNIRNILVKKDYSVTKLTDAFKPLKTFEEKRDTFLKFVASDSLDTKSKQNGGSLGWMNASKLNKNILAALKNKNKGDVIQVSTGDTGSQILFLQNIQPQRAATFEESKKYLLQFAKKEALAKEIEKRLK